MRVLRWLLAVAVVVPRAIIAFIVVACWLIFREPDDHPYLDDVDDADR